jgi:transposase-like protein
MDTNKLSDHQQTMFQMIEQCHSSGLSKKEFCEQHQIAPAKFYYWQKRYREHQQPDGFLPVKIGNSKKTSAEPVQIHYPNGVIIHLRSQAEPAFIRTLIGLL